MPLSSRACNRRFAYLQSGGPVHIPQLTVQASAALSSASLLLRRDSPAYANTLLAKAVRLHQIAVDVPGETL